MANRQNILNQEQLSIVIATILLAYTLTKYIDVPSRTITINLLGIVIPLTIDYSTIITLSIAGMTASGTDWLLRNHFRFTSESTLPHLLLPALTAWILSVILSHLPNNPLWWLVFIVGGGFLILVIFAEFITIDEEDIRRPLAIIILSALSYAMFLSLVVSLRSTNLRLIMTLPAVAISSGALSLRVVSLQNPTKLRFPEAVASLSIVTQLTVALHYLPISPMSFGLILLGTLYAITNFNTTVSKESITRNSLIEPISVLVLLWGLALWIN